MNMFSTMQSLGVDTSAFHPKIHPKIHLHRSLSVVFLAVAILLIEEILHQLVDGSHYNPIICSVL